MTDLSALTITFGGQCSGVSLHMSLQISYFLFFRFDKNAFYRFEKLVLFKKEKQKEKQK
jgi:hypothetical protein